MNHSATLPVAAQTASNTSKLAFARHYGEMILVMFAGMAVLGGLTELGLAIAGSSLDGLSGGLHVSLMGLWMTVPMVAWMAYRGHTTAQNGEMAASMIIPTILAAVLTWAGAIDTATGLAIQHAIMLPAMLAVMLWRYDEYAHVHHA
jgi:flagellar biosynthetic protein FliP